MKYKQQPLRSDLVISGILCLLSGNTLADPQLTVTPASYHLLSSQRLDRTHFLYTYQLQITNQGSAGLNVSATVKSSSASTVMRDGSVIFGDIAGGAVALSRNAFSLVQDRTTLFDPNALQWTIAVDDPNGISAQPSLPAVDARAAELATLLSVTSTPASQMEQNVRMALRESGFTLRDANEVLTSPALLPNQGTIFDAWDVGMLALGAKHGEAVHFSDLAKSVAVLSPQADPARIEALILADIRSAANSTKLSRRMWARTIIELGKHSWQPYDMESNFDPIAAELNAPQLALIMQQLAADLSEVAHTLHPSSVHQDSAMNKPIGLAGEVGSSSAITLQSTKESASTACTITDNQILVLDYAMLAANVGFDKLVEYLKELEIVPELTSEFTLGANVILEYLKLVFSVAAFSEHIIIDGGDLLQRTPLTNVDGAITTVRAHGELDYGKLAYVNCARIFLAQLGLDFSLFTNGPLEGAVVDWQNPPPGFNNNDHFARNIVQWVSGTFAQLPDAPIGTIADENGDTHIKMEGVRQQRKLSSAARKVNKPAAFRAGYSLKSSSLIQAIVDTLSAATTRGLTLPAQMLERSSLLTGEDYDFTVSDWEEPCFGSNAGSVPSSAPAGTRTTSNLQPLSTQTCADTWIGTTAFTTVDGARGTASVTWSKASEDSGGVAYIAHGQGTVDYSNTSEGRRGCTITPTSFMIGQAHPVLPEVNEVNRLGVFSATSPLQYSGAGDVLLDVTVDCPDGDVHMEPEPLNWFVGPAEGLAAVSDDGLTIQGSRNLGLEGENSGSFQFTRP